MVSVRHLLRREVVCEVPIAPPPPLECDAVLAGPSQSLLDSLVGQVRQFVQFLNQAGPAAFAHSDDGDPRVIYVVELVVAVRVKTRYAGGRKGPRGSSADNRDLPEMFRAGL